MSIHITDKLIAGTPPTYAGVTLNESFPGTLLSGTNWSNSLPTGVTVNSKLIVATGAGATDWSKYIQFAKLHMWEKQEWVINFKAVDKVANGGFGLTMSNLLTLFGSIFYLKVDLSTGANSGRVSIGLDDTTATAAGYSQALTWAAGDILQLKIRRTPKKTITIFSNLTTPSNPVAYGEFDLANWGTQGYLRLAFLTGQQEFNNITITPHVKNFGGTHGVLFCGDSITQGTGASTCDRRWTDILMRGQTHLFENIGIGAWVAATANNYLLAEALAAINPKYFVCNMGYNDAVQNTTSGFTTDLTAIVTAAQAAGCIVILINQFPNATIDKSAFAAVFTSVGASKGCKVVDIFSLAMITGNIANPQYLYTDSVHPNDNGHSLIGNEAIKQCPELYSADLLPAIDNNDIYLHSLPFGKENEDIITIDILNKLHRTSRKKIIDNGFVLLQATVVQQQAGGVGFTGNIVIGGYFQTKPATAGLQIGFNNGIADTSSSNGNITNAGAGGVGYPQAFDIITGLRNFKILATSIKNTANQTIAGNDNLSIQTPAISTLAGNYNTLLNCILSILTAGGGNVGIGSQSLKGISIGSNNIHLTVGAATYQNGTFSSALSGTIFMGDPARTNNLATVSGDIIFTTPYGTGTQFWFGGKSDATDIYMNIPSKGGVSNGTGYDWYDRASIGTGTGQPGKRIFQFSTPITTGSTLHSAFTTTMQLERTGVTVGGTTKSANAILDLQSTTQGFMPPRLTATQASALALSTTDEGLMIYVLGTNGTFTAKGWWGWDGAAWQKLNN